MKRGSVREVFLAFLMLGASSFGGPAAHIGYFREAFVVRRGWLDESAFASLVGLAQFLPGPASSQVGFAIGLRRAGWLGAAAAWVGFTGPTALLMYVLAVGQSAWLGSGALHGLKLAAVAVVAQAGFGMARSLCPDPPRAALAAAALLAVAASGTPAAQIVVIAAAGVIGAVALPAGPAPAQEVAEPVSPRVGAALIAAYLIGLALSYAPAASTPLRLAQACYRSGALVFGGGHVVLPLLRASIVDSGLVDPARFIEGYGAAQAMPGPLFGFAAYLGGVGGGAAGAAIALVAIFAPGLLLIAGAAPFAARLAGSTRARAAIAGVNAAVVGLLAAAFYNPVFTSSVGSPLDFALAAAGFVALVAWRAPPLIVVLALAATGAVMG